MDTVTCESCGRVTPADEAGEWMTWKVQVQREGRAPVEGFIHRCPACSAGAITKLLQASEAGTPLDVRDVFGRPGGADATA